MSIETQLRHALYRSYYIMQPNESLFMQFDGSGLEENTYWQLSQSHSKVFL